MSSDDKGDTLAAIGARLDKSIQEEHKTAIDAWGYNGLTVLSLALSTFASVAAQTTNWGVWVSIASAIAGFCIAIERSLGLGARWRYHTEMKSAYRGLRDGIDFVKALPESRRQSFLDDWWSQLTALRKREGQIPNSGGGQQQ